MARADPDVADSELTVSNIRMMDESSQKALLFKSLRGCDMQVIRNILQASRSLLNAKMFGYEGSDVFDIIKSKSKKCYTYSGVEKDGFFYPLHVATEAGHKNLTILLIKAGADVSLTDYKGCTAEEKCNGTAMHAFYELRGLKFEAKERYQGKTDRAGNRHGQGVLYFKPEGYMEVERQLYRGNFKSNLYSGHGTLYTVGTDVISYIGRFKEGLRHGRGIEFDAQGNKIFQGMFRDDKREGRGEEYADGVRAYKGEFSNGMRHGFGVAFFPENSKYYGRYEYNLMSGVGIYVHPNGDRFEGMFINNKPDGPGSFYERDVYTGNWSGHHALWQAGRKVKELNVPFCPTVADLPDDSNKHMFAEIMNNQEMDGMEDDPDGDAVAAKQRAAAKKRLSFCYIDANETLHNMNKTDWWKIQMGKFLKLPLKEGHYMGLRLPENLIAELQGSEDKGGDEKGEDEDEDEEEEQVEEVSGYHFMECTTLFVSYVYITSASKVFEDRLANKGLVAEFPDFEAVYHLVIDAVDTFNELWEDAYRAQQLRLDMGEMSSPLAGGGAPSPSINLLESRRKLFMSEKEKKEELILKQRAELAIKKGTAELDPKLEREIGREVLATLEAELHKLLAEESEESVYLNLPIARKNISSTASAPAAPTASSAGSVSANSSTPKQGKEGRKKTLSIDEVTSQGDASLHEDAGDIPPPPPTVDIDDLFDINNIEAAADFDGFRKETPIKSSDAEEAKRSNEFAAELLHIMRTSMYFT